MSIIEEPSSANYPGGRGFSSSTAQPNALSREWGALMAEAQAGNPTAYRKLLVELAEWLEHFYRHRLPPHMVGDGVSGALRLIHKVRHTYDPKRLFDPWLMSIAQHQCARLESAHGNRN